MKLKNFFGMYVDIPRHHHAFIEMAYVLSGTCYHKFGGSTYEQRQGCLTFINSHTWHDLHCAPDCLCLTIKVRSETFLKLDDICDSVGYSNTTQFIRDYKKKYGQTPAKYRKEFLLSQPKQ